MTFWSALLLLLIAAYVFGYLGLGWLLLWGTICVLAEALNE